MSALRIVHASAPIRICDIGGWTDTWFAKRGAVFNIAISPFVEVRVEEQPPQPGGSIRITLENYGVSYTLDPGEIVYGEYPLIDAAVDSAGLSADISLDVNVFSQAPPGASLGTSAAVTVALLAALTTIAGRHLAPQDIASLAHSVETVKLGRQCGIQDQMSSAFGGINFIQMRQFPLARVSPVPISPALWQELENRISLVHIGVPRDSSEVHEKVIAGLGERCAEDPRLEKLRRLAEGAQHAVVDGDLARLGQIMDENTDVQRSLHPQLVSESFEKAIEVARRFGAAGCKVNGAGGDGGSLTILGDGNMSRKRKMLEALESDHVTPIDLCLSPCGVKVWNGVG
jgi:D-glycero-alpha-D-manno-heptose-7-phosphate kinase